MRKMNGDLSLRVCKRPVCFAVLVPFSNNFANAKLASYSKTKAANDGSWTEVGELIRMVSDAFLASIIAVHEGSVGPPWMR